MRSLIVLLLLPFSLIGQIQFEEVAAGFGLDAAGRSVGVAVGDYDNDELEDIYVGRTGMPNLLYHALPDGTFEEVGAQSGTNLGGATRMVVWADLDNDGLLDILCGNSDGHNAYLRNNGDGTFTNRTEAAGLRLQPYTTRSINAADFDGDGDLDIYVANLSQPNELFINDGTGYFTDECDARNAQDELIAMGVICFDYDLDGDLDIYATHDSYQPNKLFENDGTGHFVEKGQFSGTGIAIQSMGVDVGDMDNDGDFDIYVTNLGANVLLRNTGIGFFQNSSFVSGVTDPGMGWGCTWLDVDNDGWQDLYVANEYAFAPVPNILYRNNSDNSFSDVSAGTVLESPNGGYGMATLDVNYDGRLELLQANLGNDQPNEVFLNTTENDHHWIRLQLEQDSLNRFAVGARVLVTTNEFVTTDGVFAGSGYASQNSHRLHFGLGADSLVDLRVFWPNGDTSDYLNVLADSLYRIRPGTAPQGIYPLGLPVTTSTTTMATTTPFSLQTNPVGNLLQLKGDASIGNETGQIIVVNASGATVATHTLGHLTLAPIDVANLPAGYYVCRLRWRGGTQALPFIKR